MRWGKDNPAAKPEYATAKIAVWWDMNDCPIPEGYEARRVRQSIEGELRKLGYFGHVSITAYCDQKRKKSPNYILRGLSSTGVSVAHAIYANTCSEIFDDILKWRSENPPPATMMLVSDHVEPLLNFDLKRLGQVPKYDIYMGWDLARLQQQTKYNLFLAYSFTSQLFPVLQTSAEWLWKELLVSNDTELSASAGIFYCKSCPFDCQSLLSFRKHLSSTKHALEELNPGNGHLDPETRTWGKNYPAKPEYATAQIAVWWNMFHCPIPEGYDAAQVRPSIEGAFKKLGYSGPVSITAYGDYTQTPYHIWQGLSSTGVALAQTTPERTRSHIFSDMMDWQHSNPPPATMMFICDELEDRVLAARQQMKKYNLFLAYSFRPYQMSVLVTSAEWLWDSLLAGVVVSETTRPLLQLSTVSETTRPLLEQCSERGESTGVFNCRSCSSFRDYKSLDDFTKHVSSTQHAMTVGSIYNRRRELEYERRQGLLAYIRKSKRLRKAFGTGFGLLHNHLRRTTSGVRPRARTFKKVW